MTEWIYCGCICLCSKWSIECDKALCYNQLRVSSMHVTSAHLHPAHHMCFWDPKHRLWLQLIPLSKALGKMNEPPPMVLQKRLRSQPILFSTCWKRWSPERSHFHPPERTAEFQRRAKTKAQQPHFKHIPVKSRHCPPEGCATETDIRQGGS